MLEVLYWLTSSLERCLKNCLCLNNWATSWQNQQNGLHVQSEPSSLCALWVAKDHTVLHANSKASDQNGQIPRLIWVFAGRTYHFVGFVLMWLNYYIHMYVLNVSVFRLIWYFWFQMYVAALEPNWFVDICTICYRYVFRRNGSNTLHSF